LRVRASVLLVSKFRPVRLEDLDVDPYKISEFWNDPPIPNLLLPLFQNVGRFSKKIIEYAKKIRIFALRQNMEFL
jgi:hypothetical protein